MKTNAMRLNAAIRLLIFFAAVAAVFWGVAVMLDVAAAATIAGVMVWADLLRGRNELDSGLPSRSIHSE
jgi:hypothetical protein